MKRMTTAAALTLPAALALGAVSITPASAASVAALTCQGQRATIVSSGGTTWGTNRADVIVLKKPGKVISGAGNDIICGSSGADVILAGAGNDIVYGAAGKDRIQGGAGDDVLFGDLGNDTLRGESGNDSLYGGPGTNVLGGGAGTNVTVNSGTVINVMFSMADLQMIQQARGELSLGTFASSSSTPAIVAASGSPMMMTQIALNDSTGIYLAANDWDVRPGMSISPSEIRPQASIGTYSIVDRDGAFLLGPVTADRSDIAMTNTVGSTLVGGRTAQVSMNGRTLETTTTAALLPAGQTVVLPKPDSATVFISTMHPQPGEIIEREQKSGITVSLAPGNTQNLVYQNGQFTRR